MCRTMSSSRIVFTATQCGSDKRGNGWVLQRRQDLEHRGKSSLRTFIIRPTLPSAAMAPCSIKIRSSIFCRFHGSAAAWSIGDEARRALQQIGDDAEIVGAQRTAGLGHLDDGVGQLGGLTSVAPQLNSTCAFDAVLRQPALRDVHDLRGDALALQILTAWIGESFGTASTQRTGRRLTLLNTSSASSITLASFSSTQS